MAFGPTPRTDLVANGQLSGAASWSGRQLGFIPRAKAVAGTADLAFDLNTFDGTLDLTEHVSCRAWTASSAVGTAMIWRDGNPNYHIEVGGNTFLLAGGDAGTVPGAFLGPLHEGMAGVLKRDD